LSDGRSVLIDRSLTVSGSTADYGVAQRVPQEVKTAVGQTCTADVAIAFTGELKTNLTWRAIHDDRGAVTLEGEVPDDASRGQLIDAAQRIFPGARFTDKMRVVAAPPEPWLSVALGGLNHCAIAAVKPLSPEKSWWSALHRAMRSRRRFAARCRAICRKVSRPRRYRGAVGASRRRASAKR
jgi:hypothetical protein